MKISPQQWQQQNQSDLSAALNEIRQILLHYATGQDNVKETPDTIPLPSPASEQWQGGSATALQHLCEKFGLSTFERQLLLLCAGMELEGEFAALCAQAQGNPQQAYPTLGLALSVFPDPHWSALTPQAPLRYWQLIEVDAGPALNVSPLRIAERVLHYLTGVSCFDAQWLGLINPQQDESRAEAVDQHCATQIIRIWSQATESAMLPVMGLSDQDNGAQLAVARRVCDELQLQLYTLAAHTLPNNMKALANLQTLMEREVILSHAAYLLEYDDTEDQERKIAAQVCYLLERLRAPCFIAGCTTAFSMNRSLIKLNVKPPSHEEQLSIWQSRLGEGSQLPLSPAQWECLMDQFHLNERQIVTIGEELKGIAIDDRKNADECYQAIWQLCRKQCRKPLAGLIRAIEPRAQWHDLALPQQQSRLLKEMLLQVKQRTKVYRHWGFAHKSSRGLGLSALFSGPSGTGKTLAAEVLANQCGLDLYCIDLSAVVSKYIGETEKNLEKIFCAAENSGAVLLFDEADALFGKRSEVNNSNDRYANMEVSYLLQRMEAYQGLSILTTNLKSAMDSAFMRRLRFVVTFTFPNPRQRAEIWQRIFPEQTPTESLDIEKLASLNITGGNIRSIALNAAFLAADADEAVNMRHLTYAIQNEFLKLDKTLTGQWVT
ncbi:MAG: ATP-binding protein [Pseudomonadales bacterium]